MILVEELTTRGICVDMQIDKGEVSKLTGYCMLLLRIPPVPFFPTFE